MAAGGNAFDELIAMGHPPQRVTILPSQRGPPFSDEAIERIIANHLNEEPPFLIGRAD
jgi:hypothetical protein